ncbi:hypothetical protein LWI29_031958 [Acer saccharum]|uniref:MORF/ORRM1/DAG-like MORF domain-containing protein n=1 Tax=Acer saccharum TaxID=4024 RepID=A0AA39RYA1_ACESA|nr:hypothetical protein LWI29_031958 [Acer saccharum]
MGMLLSRGDVDKARKKIYTISTRFYYAFGTLVPKEVSQKLKGFPNVHYVIANCYEDVENQKYGGKYVEFFIIGMVGYGNVTSASRLFILSKFCLSLGSRCVAY